MQWKPKIHAGGGLAILANPNIKCVRRKDLEEDNECIWCEVYIGNKQCLICSVYIPPRNKEDLIKLHNKLNCLKSNQPLIVGGDFNARNELWDFQLLPSRDSAWQMGDYLIEMIFEHNLMIHNNGTPTFYRKDYVSALDVTLSRNLPFKINWSTDINSILKTDHYAVIINVDDNIMDTRKLKWDFKNTDWIEWKNEIENTFKDWSKNLRVDITPDDACKSYTDNIINCANNVIPKKVVCNHSKPFMTKELKNLKDLVRKARKQYHKKSDPNNWSILQKVLNNYSKAYVEAKKLWWSSICNQVNSDDSKFWKIINKVNNGDTKCVVQPLEKNDKSHEFEDKGITEILENTHIKRCDASSDTFDHDFYEIVNNEITQVIQREKYLLSMGLLDNSEPYNSDITTNNVKSSFRSIRGKFTPGPNDILPRMLIEAEEQLIEPTTKLFQLCWENGHK